MDGAFGVGVDVVGGVWLVCGVLFLLRGLFGVVSLLFSGWFDVVGCGGCGFVVWLDLCVVSGGVWRFLGGFWRAVVVCWWGGFIGWLVECMRGVYVVARIFKVMSLRLQLFRVVDP